MEHKFVEIVWDDASAVDSWRTPDDLPALARIVTRGWLVVDDEEKVTTAGSYQEGEDMVGEIITIPRGCVVSLRVLDVQYTLEI